MITPLFYAQTEFSSFEASLTYSDAMWTCETSTKLPVYYYSGLLLFFVVIISKLISVTSTLVHCLAFTWCCRVIVFDISEKVTQKQISTMFQLSVLLHFNVYDSPRPMHKFHFQGHLPHTANALPHLSVSRIQNNIAIL